MSKSLTVYLRATIAKAGKTYLESCLFIEITVSEMLLIVNSVYMIFMILWLSEYGLIMAFT